jgi:hypothetical protein
MVWRLYFFAAGFFHLKCQTMETSKKKSSSTLPLAKGEYPTKEGEGVAQEPASSVQPPVPSITDNIIAALGEFYQPTGDPAAMELKTTMDLIDEMAAISDIEKWTITLALQIAGFKLKYTDAGLFWVLYKV